MSKDVLYTNGVIAVKETALLGAKIAKLSEGTAEEAFRALKESGFGHGAETETVFETEKLLTADELDICAFVREYAPTNADKEYILTPYDFHNAKAVFKAEKLGESAAEMLAPEGLFTYAEIENAVKNKNYSALSDELREAVEEAERLYDGEEEKNEVSGADVGRIFDAAAYKRLFKACGKFGVLKKLLTARVDMINILTFLRAQTPEYAEVFYVQGGKLGLETLKLLCDEDKEKAAHTLDGTAYADFLKLCLADKNAGLPMTDAEKFVDGFELDFLAKRKYELKRSQPFLYYVFKRKAENANVRILIGGLLAGMDERGIKKRLRGAE